MAIKKVINNPLINTWETLDKLREDYFNEINKFTNPAFQDKFRQYFLNMDKFERDILVLYAEYDSYRKVAEEVGCSHQTIKLILMVIRQDIQKL